MLTGYADFVSKILMGVALLAAASVSLPAVEVAGKAAALATELKQAGLDPDACYRVRDLAFQKEDLRFYLTEGHLIFSKPVRGRRFAAMFTAEIPGGDAEVLLFPPLRSERMSLAHFAKSPNLNEHFMAALFLFSDGTGEELLKQIESGEQKRLPEIGTDMASRFRDTLRNLVSSYEIRLVQDRFTSQPERTGFFYAGISTRTVGNIDFVYDQRQRDQIVVGQVAYRQERRFFDTWTSFQARSFRTGQRNTIRSSIHLDSVNINATLEPPELHMKAVTTMEITAREDGDTAIPFELATRVTVTGAKVDGVPAEIFRGESFRANLMRGGGGVNETFLLMMPQAVKSGEKHKLEFTHEGTVVQPAGNGVYYVASRLNWYPNRDAEFSNYEMTFRHPRTLRLVATETSPRRSSRETCESSTTGHRARFALPGSISASMRRSGQRAPESCWRYVLTGALNRPYRRDERSSFRLPAFRARDAGCLQLLTSFCLRRRHRQAR